MHPTAVIGPGVQLGIGVSIGPYAVLTGPLQVGNRVWIGSGSHLGAPPEIIGVKHNLGWDADPEHAGIVVQDDVVIREVVVVHQGSWRETVVGQGSWLLSRCYLAHDVQLGAGVIVSAGVSIGGHCSIRTGANLGMNVSVHQGRQIGAGAMVGMGATVARDVPPYAKVFGVPLRLAGVNAVGLRRAGVGEDAIEVLAAAYGASGVDLTTADLERLPHEVRAELDWWMTLPDRRPPRSAFPDR